MKSKNFVAYIKELRALEKRLTFYQVNQNRSFQSSLTQVLLNGLMIFFTKLHTKKFETLQLQTENCSLIKQLTDQLVFSMKITDYPFSLID
jgi:hypothetical protein